MKKFTSFNHSGSESIEDDSFEALEDCSRESYSSQVWSGQ